MQTHTKIMDPAEVATWLSGVIAIAMHYAGQMPLDPAALGAMITAAVLPIAMAIVRIGARFVASLPDDVGNEDGKVLVPALVLMLVVGLTACGSHYALSSGGWRLSANADGSTCLKVHGDGDPEVTSVCIAKPEPLRMSPATRDLMCAHVRTSRATTSAPAADLDD